MTMTQLFSQTCTILCTGLLLINAHIPAMASGTEGIKIGFHGGACVPQAGVADVYENLKANGLVSSYKAAGSNGFHIGARVRVGITENISLQGTASFNHFSDQEQKLTIGGVAIPSIVTSSNHVPITAGVMWLPIQSVVKLGASAELVFAHRFVGLSASQRELLENYTSDVSSFEYQRSGLGAALGVMASVNIIGLEPFVEIKNVWSNAFMQQNGDPKISFLQISLGIML